MSDMDAWLAFGVGFFALALLFWLGVPFLLLLIFFDWQTAALITLALFFYFCCFWFFLFMKLLLPVEILEFSLERNGYWYKCGGYWMSRAHVLDILNWSRHENY